MITGSVDLATAQAYRDEFRALVALHDARVTQCAHIFAPSTNYAISGANVDGPKHNYAASAWAVMQHMGNVSLDDELNGANIYRLENVMTLTADMHLLFDCLELWLEATNVANQYNVCRTFSDTPATVTFRAQGNLPLPDPRYLALHAACAKVAHLSGAGEYIDTIDRDIATTMVLAHDGSSAKVLGEALSRVGVTA